MQKFDDAEFHFLNFTSDLPNEAGGIPVGLYLAWAADAGLVEAELAAKIEGRRGRGQTSADILFELVDGKLTSDEFNEEGAAFTDAYYAASFVSDFCRCFRIAEDSSDALCSVPDTPASSTRLKPYLNERLVAWRAQPRVEAPTSTPQTAAGLFAFLERELFPELVADGYEIRSEGRNMALARRCHGLIEQQLLYMTLDHNGSGSCAFRIYLGAKRVREAWLGLCDVALATSPPRAFSINVRHGPDVSADVSSLAADGEHHAAYFRSIPEGPDRLGLIELGYYRDKVRPRMNALLTVAALAEQVLYPGQATRLRQRLGSLDGSEVLARIVLLSTYTNLFHGDEGPELVKQLHTQIVRNISRKPDDFPTVTDVDALVSALKVPGTVERVRAMLDA